MLNQWIRVFYGDNGVLTDYSLEAQDNTSTIPVEMVAAEDYLYIGQYLPFNNFFIEMDTANSNASVLSCQKWTGTEWDDCVDVIDATKSSGVTLAQNGVVQFSPDDDSSWIKVPNTRDDNNPSDLSSIAIFNLYWLRIKVSADLSAGTDIKRLTYKFSDDDILSTLDPDINEYLTSWEAGKTSWLDQILTASKLLVLDVRSRGMIKTYGQILRFDDVYHACAYETLSIIYSGLGPKFIEKKQEADKEYKRAIGSLKMTLDIDKDARVDIGEIGLSQGRLIR